MGRVVSRGGSYQPEDPGEGEAHQDKSAQPGAGDPERRARGSPPRASAPALQVTARSFGRRAEEAFAAPSPCAARMNARRRG